MISLVRTVVMETVLESRMFLPTRVVGPVDKVEWRLVRAQ
jgi:hypothetical protein